MSRIFVTRRAIGWKRSWAIVWEWPTGSMAWFLWGPYDFRIGPFTLLLFQTHREKDNMKAAGRVVIVPKEPTPETIERMAKAIELANNNSSGMKFSDLLRCMASMAYMEAVRTDEPTPETPWDLQTR